MTGQGQAWIRVISKNDMEDLPALDTYVSLLAIATVANQGLFRCSKPDLIREEEEISFGYTKGQVAIKYNETGALLRIRITDPSGFDQQSHWFDLLGRCLKGCNHASNEEEAYANQEIINVARYVFGSLAEA